MTRLEKRQEKREQEQALKMKELEAKGFNFVGSEEYQEKRAIANRKRIHEGCLARSHADQAYGVDGATICADFRRNKSKPGQAKSARDVNR